MKKSLLKISLLLSGVLLFAACEKNENDLEPENQNQEFRHIRLLVSDENTTAISLVNPFQNELMSFQAQYPKSALYTTESGRFAGVIHREDNLLQTFDIGLEYHGDHVDVKGTPKFGAMIGQSSKPTHFKSKRGEILTFNDGDGTLSIGRESDIHTPNMKLQVINAKLTAHHGAMAHFSNGTYAITEKTGDIPGTLPEQVKIIDANGNEKFAAKLATKGIHGNATDGKSAVFGSASGILVVSENGDQKFIPHPSDFGTAWFGTILETSRQGYFLGYTAAMGIYLIDIAKNEVKPLFESTDIMQANVSMDGTRVGILTHAGEFVYKEISTGNTLKTINAMLPAVAKTETQKPQLVISGRFAYLTQPKTGELLMVNIQNPSVSQRFKVSPTPYRITLMGYENNELH